ncbi:MAG: hypothetical protein LLF76_14435 [Planctomycetaceae bacterium]|nr:hypothetical protein [Planctomycetaceae bacterium]
MEEREMSIKEQVQDELRPNGVWQLSEAMEGILAKAIRRMPSGEVSTEERRYPTTHKGMRACLDSFFARHFFQAQEVILDHVSNDTFLSQMANGQLRILDIGSGSGASALGTIDILRSVADLSVTRKSIRIDCVFNDACELCLSYSRQLTKQYFEAISSKILRGRIITVEKSFPASQAQLGRIARLTGSFDLILMSYVLSPLFDNYKNQELAGAFHGLGQLVNPNGLIVLIQDQFHKEQIRKAADMLKTSVRRHKHKQQIYSKENSNDIQDYCFFSAVKKGGRA